MKSAIDVDFVKNIVIGLFAIIGLVIAGFLIYGIGGLIIGLIGLIVSVVVAVAPIVLGVASAIFLVIGGAYAIGKAIREGGANGKTSCEC